MSQLSEKTNLAFTRLGKTLGTMTSDEAGAFAAKMEEMIQWYGTLEFSDSEEDVLLLEKGERPWKPA